MPFAAVCWCSAAKPKPAAGGGGGMNALFGEINKGLGVTAGLRKASSKRCPSCSIRWICILWSSRTQINPPGFPHIEGFLPTELKRNCNTFCDWSVLIVTPACVSDKFQVTRDQQTWREEYKGDAAAPVAAPAKAAPKPFAAKAGVSKNIIVHFLVHVRTRVFV